MKEWSILEIRAFRKTLNLTQAEFARALGLANQQKVSLWETGKHRPSRTGNAMLNDLFYRRKQSRGIG